MTCLRLIYDLLITIYDFPNISFSCQRAGIEIPDSSKAAV
jgi:hypothetical protein